eukprot:301777_1
MGCTIEGQDRIDAWYDGLILKPRLLDHLQCFRDTPIPKKHAARWAKIIVVLCDRVYTEYEDPEAEEKKEDDDDDDVDMDIEEEEDTKQEMEVEDKKEDKKEDDGSGPYLINTGQPRCLDDIAYIAMRSLEMW